MNCPDCRSPMLDGGQSGFICQTSGCRHGWNPTGRPTAPPEPSGQRMTLRDAERAEADAFDLLLEHGAIPNRIYAYRRAVERRKAVEIRDAVLERIP